MAILRGCREPPAVREEDDQLTKSAEAVVPSLHRWTDAVPSKNFLEPVKRKRLEAMVIDAGHRGGLEHRVVDRLLRCLGDGLEERGDLVIWQILDGVAALRRAGVRRTASAVAKARA